MGLTAHDMSDMGRLAQLAMNPRDGASREEIYLAVASLYRIQGAGLNDRERELMREILRRLTRDVEMAIRIALAERLADDITAPHDLILLLVDDAIEVARPLILRSPLLTERRHAAPDRRGRHRPSGSRGGPPPYRHAGDRRAGRSARPNRFWSPWCAMPPRESPRPPIRRWWNARAPSPGCRSRCCSRADLPRRTGQPHVRLGFRRAESLYPGQLQDGAKTGRHRLGGSGRHAAAARRRAPSDPPADSAQKLIEKLAVSGQLKAGFLMRVLSQGQIDLFELAFARLLELDLTRFRQLFYDGGVRVVALACRAGGIDKAAFPHRLQSFAPGAASGGQPWPHPDRRSRSRSLAVSPAPRRWRSCAASRSNSALAALLGRGAFYALPLRYLRAGKTCYPDPMQDSFGRPISYLRVSVTDRCDFRCVYCMSEHMSFLPKAEVLSLEELERLCARLHRQGRGAPAHHRRRTAGAQECDEAVRAAGRPDRPAA